MNGTIFIQFTQPFLETWIFQYVRNEFWLLKFFLSLNSKFKIMLVATAVLNMTHFQLPSIKAKIGVPMSPFGPFSPLEHLGPLDPLGLLAPWTPWPTCPRNNCIFFIFVGKIMKYCEICIMIISLRLELTKSNGRMYPKVC